MNSFNEKQPEEKDPEYEALMTLLQHVNLDAMFVDPHEQAQALSKVRARLFPADHEGSPPDAHEMPELSSLPSKPRARKSAQDQRGRFMHLINVLAAVLVIMVLMSSILLLFGPWSPLHQDYIGTTTPTETFGAPRKVGSLEMSLKITSSPYFLNELLEVDLMVTNPTPTPYSLFPTDYVDPLCSQLLNIVTTDGGSPHTLDFHHYWTGLPWPSRNCFPLSPRRPPGIGFLVLAHQTFTYKSFIQLTSSGHVTLTAKQMSLWVRTQTDSGIFAGALDRERGYGPIGYTAQTDSGIFAGALDDTLHLFVSPHVPSDRQLSKQEQKAQVVVSGPPAVNGHLFGRIGSVCPGPGGGTVIGDLGQLSGTTVVLKQPSGTCGDNGPKPLWWTYVVGAPGYTLVFGMVNG
jgi:hypothetical protein